jgi:alkanesulfonate monooxygenase SsuD/methylene tetrahydromethanopterin reductase-like flavin-dependent oxidoreductase (luciferase family)
LPPPVESIAWTDAERAGTEHALACSVVGDRADVEAGLRSVIDQTQADELIVTAQIFDHAARLRSFEITAQARDALA